MDFVYLVEKGTYSKKDLKKDQKDFINGIEFAMDELDRIRDIISSEKVLYRQVLDTFCST